MISKMREKLKKGAVFVWAIIACNASKVFAVTTPDEEEVNEIASKGLKIFFGALAGIAILFAVFEFYGAFIAHRENKEQGGFGGAQDDFSKKIFAGIMCLIAAGIVFLGLHWTQSLFDLA